MKTELRKIAIYNLIKVNKKITVKYLASYFDVSEMTIRRDLDDLEKASLIRREYGCAILADELKAEPNFSQRLNDNSEGKRHIAENAIGLLENFNTVFVDGSTTVRRLIDLIPEDSTFTVYTDSVEALHALTRLPRIKIFLIGGFLAPDGHTFDAGNFMDVVKRIYVDATFTSCGGFSEDGMFNNEYSEVQIKRAVMNNAYHNFLLADHTKMGVKGLILSQVWEKIDVLVTDRKPSDGIIRRLEENSARVIW